jgi:hypothetical protein
VLYLGMMPFAIFTLWVRFSAVVPGDAAATAANVAAANGWFRAAIVSWLVSQTMFIFLLLRLYDLLEPVDNAQARSMVILGLLGVPVAFLNELNQFAALLLTGGAGYLRAFDPAQLHAALLLVLRLHDHGIYIAHVFWGLWLLPFGYLVYRSGFLPRLLGVLVLIAGAGYLADFVRYVLAPDLAITLTQFTFVGELLLPLWLVVRGVDARRWEELANGSARMGPPVPSSTV